jgi:glycerol dehydrogenase
MFKKSVFPGKYIQGAGALRELPALIALLGNQGLVLASPSVKAKLFSGGVFEGGTQSVPVEISVASVVKKSWLGYMLL